MKYRRLKTLDSTSTPILRYYKLADGETPPFCNCFYIIQNEEAKKQEGEKTGPELVGFSHGGNNLAKGLVFLDINETPLYMGIFEEGEDTRPEIGDLVNGYQRVIDTHYDGDAGVDGKNDEDWGVEVLDNPYYVFHIEQNMAESETETVDDENAGDPVPQVIIDGGKRPQPRPEPTPTPDTVTVTFSNVGGQVIAPPDNPEVWSVTFAKGTNLKTALQNALDDYYESIELDRNLSRGPGARKQNEAEEPLSFGGWYEDPTDYDPDGEEDLSFNCNQSISEDMTLYAAFDTTA